MQEQLIKLFYEYLPAWSWEEWQAAGSSDREEIVINAIADLGPSMNIDVEEAYDLFYDWAAGLTEADFGRKITESTIEDPYGYGPYKTFSDPSLKVGDYVLTERPFNKSGRTYPARITNISSKWIEYEISGFGFTDRGTKARPGSATDKALKNARTYIQNMGEAYDESLTEAELKEYFEGSLSDFDGDPNEILKSFANEPSYSGYAADLAGISNRSGPGPDAARTKEDIKLRDKCLAAAQKAIESGDEAIERYNRGRWSRYFDRAFVPAIDPETLELVYDKNKKSDICVGAFAAMHHRQYEYRTNYDAKRKAEKAAVNNENIEEIN